MGSERPNDSSSNCVSRIELLQLARGDVSAARRQILAVHVDSCPHCLSELDALSNASDGITEELSAPAETIFGSEAPPTERIPSEESDDSIPTTDFLARLSDSGLAPSGEEIRTLTEAASNSGDGRAVAEIFVARGVLTEYQAKALLHPGPPVSIGRFRILRELGTGGMGVVYDVFDPERQARVALKTLPRIDADSLLRFKREFRAVADLHHPNLVQLHELMSEEDRWFFTMDRIDGVGFLSYVRRGGHEEAVATVAVQPRDPSSDSVDQEAGSDERNDSVRLMQVPADLRRLRSALVQLTDGLNAIHAEGLLHRDIKPSNVLVDGRGRVVILDFGLVAEAHAIRHGRVIDPDSIGGSGYAETSNLIVGTVNYMSPEQAGGRSVTPASDWYSVGVMLYEALTGRRPFTGTPRRVLRMKQDFDPPPPHDLAEGVPEDLDRLCMALLSRDAAVRPNGAEIAALLREGRGETDSKLPGPEPVRAFFVGREEHLEALRRSFDEVRAGSCMAVLVHGRSGVGKSTLIRRFLDDIGAIEPVLLHGRCYEQESVPYKALDSLVDRLSQFLGRLSDSELRALTPPDMSALARIFPVLRRFSEEPGVLPTADPRELRRIAFGALRELLCRLGARSHLILALDDLQWGDVDSAHLLGDLLRAPGSPRLLLLASYRSEYADASEFLRLFHQSLQGEHAPPSRNLEVDAFSPEESRELASKILGDAATASTNGLEAVVREARGIPYFLHELSLHVRGGSVLASGRVDLDGVIWARIERLSTEARSLLETIAVAGRPIRLRDAYDAAGLPAGDRQAVTVLRSEKLVRGTGPRLADEIDAFHDRIRESVLPRIAQEARRAAHGRLAKVLEASGIADAEALAVHFAESGDGARGVMYFERAADEAAEALAFDHAARLYRSALDLGASDGSRALALRRKLARTLADAGRGYEAGRVYRECAVEASGPERREHERHAAYQFCISGRFDEGREMLDTILGRVGRRLERSHGRALMSVLLRLTSLRLRGVKFLRRSDESISAQELELIDVIGFTGVGLSMIDSVTSMLYLTESLQRSLAMGEPRRIARYLSLHASSLSTQGVRVRPHVLRVFGIVEALVLELGEPDITGVFDLASGSSAFLMGRWNEALTILERALKGYSGGGAVAAWELNTIQTFRLQSLFNLGRFREMSERWAAERVKAQDRGDLQARVMLEAMAGTEVRLVRDEPEAARAEARAVMAEWSREGFHLPHYWLLQSETWIDLYDGAGLVALNRLRDSWGEMSRSMNLRPQVLRCQMIWMRASAAILAVHTGEAPRSTLKRAAQDAKRLDAEGLDWATGLAGLVRGGLAEASGDDEGARREFASASVALDGCDCSALAIAARRRFGLLTRGDRGRAIVAEADAALAAEGVVHPARFVRMLTGGGVPVQ